MGLISSKIERDELRPGDHIYTWRRGYSYSHHGIYVDDGKVIHHTRGPGLLIFSSSSQSSRDCVIRCDIEDFLCDGQLYRFQYGVSEFVFLMKRPGTCSLASCNPPEQVLHNASYLIGYGFGNYNLLNRNCEDFAIYCKTGFIKTERQGSFSGQISSLFAAVNAVTIIPYRFLPANFIGLALVVCGLYCLFRLGSDVRWGRRDFDVVPVEKLAHLRRVHYTSENVNTMENSTARWSLRDVGYHLITIAWLMRILYWTPENTTLLWIKSYLLHTILSNFVFNHLKLHGFKLGDYSAYNLWLLGDLYWRWTSVSTILLWTKSCFLFQLVSSFVFDRPQELKLNNYLYHTLVLYLLWYWTPRFIILRWIKLGLVYMFISMHLINHGLMRWEAVFVCFVIQSAALFIETGLYDYVFRIIKITFSINGV